MRWSKASGRVEVDGQRPQGLKPGFVLHRYAALKRGSSTVAPAFVGRRAGLGRRAACAFATFSAATFFAIFLSGAAPEKHLSIYSVAANYSLPLLARNGRDYVGLLELLEPLGAVNARGDGDRWRLSYNRLQAEFTAGKTRVHIPGRETPSLPP